MTAEQWSLIVSFIAMLFVAGSYFLKKKSGYLTFQALGMICLIASYLLDGLYFAMIGLGVGLARALVFFVYEKQDKESSIWWSVFFSALTILVYLVINVGILKEVRIEDTLYLIGLILYAFVFRIRDLEWMRYAVTIPTSLCILYNVLCQASPFVVLSYVIELGANLVAIVQFHIIEKIKEKKEIAHEEN